MKIVTRSQLSAPWAEPDWEDSSSVVVLLSLRNAPTELFAARKARRGGFNEGKWFLSDTLGVVEWGTIRDMYAVLAVIRGEEGDTNNADQEPD